MNELTAAGFKRIVPVSAGRKPWSNYYEPLRDRLHLLAKPKNRPQALIDLMAEFEREIDVYDCAGNDVALFFLARCDSNPE